MLREYTRRDFLKAALDTAAATAGMQTLGFLFPYKMHAETKLFGQFRIRYDPATIPYKSIEEFMSLTQKSYENLTRYLGRRYRGYMLIDIVDFPSNNSFAFPEERRIEIPKSYFLKNKTGIVHELPHMVLNHRENAGSALHAEGIAVHIQDLFGWEKMFPNDGRHLHEFMASYSKEYLVPLEKLDKMRSFYLLLPFSQSKIIYGQAGSFAKFLIEDISRNDVERYVAFHEEGLLNSKPGEPAFPYKKYFNAELEELENHWLDVLDHYRKQN